ncbi:ribosomal subunit interface protein [Faunimonas pinastri]|uniref:Ribosomal subunit interface protein n=1 Tax=Faunimonas pinastri TaxID=1855383 RepID=A0A1H9JH59_9HYPH|nr:ribosome-associated translation inhibitor RaiA [Faunimonas pinastri]SEQ85875.1 ribosomal subunit interface protein [Faunimonas pinastri]
MQPQVTETEIRVQSSKVDLGDTLPAHATESIQRLSSKYLGQLNNAAVHFNKDGTLFRCTVTMQMGSLAPMNGEAKDRDIYTAFNAALDKVAKQLRRTKRQLREDKPERTDKDALLRDGNHAATASDEEE